MRDDQIWLERLDSIFQKIGSKSNLIIFSIPWVFPSHVQKPRKSKVIEALAPAVQQLKTVYGKPQTPEIY